MKWQITEKSIAVIWQQKIVTHLVADTGEEVEVIHPGKRNVAEGSDFTGGVFLVGGRMVEGEVELHVASSEWYSHGHNRDTKSDSIVLHVVWYCDTYQRARLRDGKTVPTVALSDWFGSIVQHLSYGHGALTGALPRCPNSYGAPVLGLVALMGEARFFAKVSSVKDVLVRNDADRLLVRKLCRALGYAQNCVPFEKLADGLPIEVARGHMGSTERKALLFGFAGLLPSQRVGRHNIVCGDDEVRELEMLWRSIGNRGIVDETEWCFFRVRPDNFPPRRVGALSELLSRYDESGLLNGILGLLRQAPYGIERSWLEKGLIVNTDGYWENHIDFGVAKANNSALIGRRRAAEVAVNVILPFVFAWGEIFKEPHLSEGAFAIFLRYGKIADNEITRYMRQQLGIDSELELSTTQNQGLIYLFKAFCHRRRCNICPLANPERGWVTRLCYSD